MPSAAGMVLAAGGIAAANEAIFAPMAEGKDISQTIKSDLNLWRIIPATAFLALALGGLEKVSPPLGKGLAALVIMAVLFVPVGNAPVPMQTIGKVVSGK